jgi:hypothetical protein
MVLRKIQIFAAVFLEEIAFIFILSFITGMPVMKIANQILNSSIRSYHIFRKSRVKRVYNILRKYRQLRIILAHFISKTKPRLIIDGTILPAVNVNRVRTQKIKKFKDKIFWVKRNRNLYSEHYEQKAAFEEHCYGVLVMVLCDTNGIVYDIWFHPDSYHEVKSFRIRSKISGWFTRLVQLFEVIGDKGYKGCANVYVCETKEDKDQRQIIKGVALSRWRKGIILLTYLYAYAIGYSFFRSIEVEPWG